MGGIGHEAAASLLRGLQAAGETVELRGDLADLVRAVYLGPMVIGAFPDTADGLEQAADAAGEHPREQQADTDDQHRYHHGNGHQIFLQPLQQTALLGIVLIGVYHTDDLAAVYNRCCGPAQKSLPVIHAVKGIVAVQGLGNLCVKGVLPPGVFLLAGVIQHPGRGVCDQYAAGTCLLQTGQSLLHIALCQGGEAREGRLNDLHAAVEGRLLGTEHQVLRLDERVCIQNDQHHRYDGEVAQADLKLQTALHFENSTPLPTWSGYNGAEPGPAPASPAGGGYARPLFGSPRRRYSPRPDPSVSPG